MVTIPPGPNSPVGDVWIGLNRPHVGIHGTPRPGAIGRDISHGCVRLTNWDAKRLALMLRPGASVAFGAGVTGMTGSATSRSSTPHPSDPQR